MSSRITFATLAGAGLLAAVSLLQTACSAEGSYSPLAPGEGPSLPQVVVLRDEPSISTMHFPRGVYRLEAQDNAGYYYRAPRRLMKHAFAGFQTYDGGIYVSKRSPQKLRGYLVWAGGRTKIGDLSSAHLQFGATPEPTSVSANFSDPEDGRPALVADEFEPTR
ncbi:MAG: hypothetical protein ABI992_01715 [Chthoniobacterales bacterium]